MKKSIFLLIVPIILCLTFTISYCENFKIIKLKTGDTLWSISKQVFNDPFKWYILAKINNISNPNSLLAGLEIKVPVNVDEYLKGQVAQKLDEGVKPKTTGDKDIKALSLEGDTDLMQKLKVLKTPVKEAGDISEAKGLKKPLKEKKATITYIKGEIRIKNNVQKIWINLLKAGAPLYKNDIMETSDNSIAMLSFEDGSYIKLMPNTRIKLIKSVYDKIDNTLSSSVYLNQGIVEAFIRPVSPITPEFKILSQNIESDGAGKFNVKVNKRGDLNCEVIDGVLNVKGGNKVVQIKSNYGLFVPGDKIPGIPVKLLPPPKLISPPDKVYVKSSLPTFKFTEVEKAVKYKIQIAKEETFNVLVLEDNYITSTTYKSKALLDGFYYWRIASIDLNGLTGKYSNPRVMKIDTTSPRLIISSPLEDEIIKGRTVKIRGVTEPGFSVKINQFTIYPDKKGNISIDQTFKYGTNVVLFSVKDTTGNATNFYRTFHLDGYGQIEIINGKNFCISDQWNVNIYNARGQVILNDRFYEVDFGSYSQPLIFKTGNNHLITSLEDIGYKDFLFIYDNDKPIIKQLRISPIIKDDVAYLNIFLKAEDKTSALEKKAEIVLEEYANVSNRYFVDLIYSEALNEFQGAIAVRPKVLKKELSIASLKITDIAGNTTEIKSGSLDRPNQPSGFWTKARSNYSSFKIKKGIPVFLLSTAGLLLLL